MIRSKYVIFTILFISARNSRTFLMEIIQPFQVSNRTGLQKNFFDFVGTDNPFVENEKYENLPYCKKVIILKSVCDNLAVRHLFLVLIV